MLREFAAIFNTTAAGTALGASAALSFSSGNKATGYIYLAAAAANYTASVIRELKR